MPLSDLARGRPGGCRGNRRPLLTADAEPHYSGRGRVRAHFVRRILMRAETQALVDEIRGAVALIRRHL